MDAYSMIPPEGYWKVSVEQLHRADLQLFKVMMRETRSGIKPLGGNKPMEAALRKAMDAAEVRLYLQPLQGVAQRKVEPVQEDDAKKAKSNDIAKLQKTVENLQGQLKNIRDSGSSSSQGKGKAKGRGKNKGNMIRMPPQLIGLSPTTATRRSYLLRLQPERLQQGQTWRKVRKRMAHLYEVGMQQSSPTNGAPVTAMRCS